MTVIFILCAAGLFKAFPDVLVCFSDNLSTLQLLFLLQPRKCISSSFFLHFSPSNFLQSRYSFSQASILWTIYIHQFINSFRDRKMSREVASRRISLNLQASAIPLPFPIVIAFQSKLIPFPTVDSSSSDSEFHEKESFLQNYDRTIIKSNFSSH